jgi:hypothetical protein
MKTILVAHRDEAFAQQLTAELRAPRAEAPHVHVAAHERAARLRQVHNLFAPTHAVVRSS